MFIGNIIRKSDMFSSKLEIKNNYLKRNNKPEIEQKSSDLFQINNHTL